MKNIRIMALALSTALVLTGASVWEGAAAVASNGELPEGGYYAATNSFPRNTVVDLSNLENGKSVRIIVASGLDSPGLLAVISRDAADAIGMQSRSIGRIRMTQPSDPVAFSRFTEGRESSGDPDFDPRAAVASGALPEEIPAEPETAETAPEPPVSSEAVPEFIAGTWPETDPEPPAPAEAVPDAPEPPEEFPPQAAVSETGFGDPPVYPEWPEEALLPAEETPLSEPGPDYLPPDEYFPDERIVDIPEAYEPPAIASRDDSIIPEPAPVWIYSEESPDAPEISSLPAASEPVSGLSEPEDLFPETSLPEEAPDGSGEGLLPVPWENYDLALIPAEERPPEPASAGLSPEAEIAPIPEAVPAAEPPIREPYMDSGSFIDPIGPAPVEPPVNEPYMDSGSFIGLPERAAAEPAAEPEPEDYPSAVFSVPVISQLEQGKYYLQLAAFSRAEAVEQELSKIDRNYPLAVQSGGSPEQPLYRVLVGPVNLGESGALLQRFKGNGWGDAFIRNGS